MPASGRLLLDTNIVIALLEGDNAVLSNLDHAPEVFIPAIVVGELFFGAAKSGRPSENTAKVERFVAAAEATSSGEGEAPSGERHLDRRYGEMSRTGSGYP